MRNDKMKVIGITGGVGSGKSEVIKILSEICNCYVLKADDLARSLEVKGEVCYGPLVELLGKEVLDKEGEIDARKMAAAIFADGKEDLLAKVNAIVHPAVKSRILSMIEDARRSQKYDMFFIEAALLIEDGYDRIVDELWYIYADEDVRRKRLKESRGYSDEKISGIFESQSSDETFRKYCKVVIDNSGDINRTKEQLRYYCG